MIIFLMVCTSKKTCLFGIWIYLYYYIFFIGNTVCANPAQSGNRSTEVNMSKLPASAPSPSQLEDPASIQVAIPETILKSTENNKLPNGFGSFKSLCGPNPKKGTIAVVIVLSIWASFILGINIEKKVSYTFQFSFNILILYI